MNFNKFKRAFSLTELLIVLVIVAVLFAALAPIITKRINGSETNLESVWRFTDGNTHDAYYDSEMPKATSAAFVGFEDQYIREVYKKNNYSKLNLKAVEINDKIGDKNVKYPQGMIHFRYGDGDGKYTGSFTFDANGNLKTVGKVSYSDLGENNTAAGMDVLYNYTNPKENVAIGARTMAADLKNTSGSYVAYSNVAAGVKSGEYLSGSNNTFLGANTGRTESKGAINNTVALGATVLNHATSRGNNNVFAGSGVMSVGLSTSSNDNVVLGSTYYSENSQNNTIIGYDVYTGKTTTQSNLTAVGYESCMSVSDPGDGTTNTCIGYGSAKNKGVYTGTPASGGGTVGFDIDRGDHIYLGGSPKGFGGRSVLEVHNFSLNYGPTVVMNSNLVVRGNLFTQDKDGELSSHESFVSVTGINSKKGATAHDKCCRNGWGHIKWHDSDCKSILDYVVQGLVIVLLAAWTACLVAGVIITAGGAAGLIIAGVFAGTIGGGIGGFELTKLFDPDKYKSSEDPISGSGRNFSTKCTSSGTYYPTQNACPDLQLSDIRLKENITDNTDALEKIMLVMPYNYTYKFDENGIPQVGVIAQDLQKYLPNSVSTDDKGFLQIRKDELFYVTINSIKALDNKLKNISNDVDSLEKESDKISKNHKLVEKRIESLNKRVNKLEK